jgi:REP element-mobilizing transposase RayT
MAMYEPQKHHRRSIRLKGYDYTQPGAYFITLVTYQREYLFGEVVKGEVVLNEWGYLALNEWQRLGQRYEQVIIDESIVMPNHVHGILLIRGKSDAVGAGQETTLQIAPNFFAPPLPHAPLRDASGVVPGSVGAIVGAYKSTTSRLINGLRNTIGASVWQRNYYERIIRDEAELRHIREYILNNPLKWELDLEKLA